MSIALYVTASGGVPSLAWFGEILVRLLVMDSGGGSWVCNNDMPQILVAQGGGNGTIPCLPVGPA